MNEDKNKQLFLSLIYSFQMQTMMQLGKLANPMSGKIERELEGAQVTIDMLDMLKEKSANNISDDEKRFLEQVIADLKLNFVEEKAKGPSDAPAEEIEEKNDTAEEKKEEVKD
ncbi:MAG: DUF1844 domain-containing protein [Ignavibacteria bacterium]|nr:DUF1844 domain-containing protein [Ignavibacteria bacterium]MBK7253234.1 DUF1844 domain-containing protein [Ignavibacteria bacterium]MBK7446678.1 DUF1844 domain-containing protein [Ignavibacteria bacterium]MBL0106527.1 DUF1844 domain-containing protein [Ignavibacteria bacterium]